MTNTTYDEASKSFAIGGTPVTEEQVREYDRFKQIEWVSDEWRAWAQRVPQERVAASSPTSSLGDHLNALKWWQIALGLVFLPFTILFLVYLMWRRDMFSKNARVALSVVGALLAVGLISPAWANNGSPPAEQPRAEQPQVPKTESPAPEPTSQPEPEPGLALSQVTVSRVVDGDTAEVTYPDGKVEKVRFIGVDTPESTNEIEPYGKEASGYTKRQLDGKTVYLETDAELRDRYGRLLAYVWLAQPSSAEPSETELRKNLFNAKLALDGYAEQLTIPPNTKYADHFAVYVAEARAAERGLWNPGLTLAPKPPPAPAPKPAPTPAPKPRAPSNSDTTVYITKTGEKYHRDGCSSLRRSKIPTTLAEAKDRGYEPCKLCDPPE